MTYEVNNCVTVNMAFIQLITLTMIGLAIGLALGSDLPETGLDGVMPLDSSISLDQRNEGGRSLYP